MMTMSNFMFFLIWSHIPDNFQGVTEIVSDGLPKPSRVNIVTKENFKVLWAQQNTIDLRPEDLSTNGLDRFHGKWCKKAAYQISVWPMSEILKYS